MIIDGPTWLVIRQDLPGVDADDAIPWFHDPERLARWWGDEYRISPVAGGEWVIAWPRIGKTLQGSIAAIGPRELLVSWLFPDEPHAVPRALSAVAQASTGGSVLDIRHGPFVESDHEERAGILEGWAYFLPRLESAIATTHDGERSTGST